MYKKGGKIQSVNISTFKLGAHKIYFKENSVNFCFLFVFTSLELYNIH